MPGKCGQQGSRALILLRRRGDMVGDVARLALAKATGRCRRGGHAARHIAAGRSHPGTKVEGRVYIWAVAAPHLAEHPFFGTGLGSFAALYPSWEGQFWSQRGEEQRKAFAAAMDYAHNGSQKLTRALKYQ